MEGCYSVIGFSEEGLAIAFERNVSEVFLEALQGKYPTVRYFEIWLGPDRLTPTWFQQQQAEGEDLVKTELEDEEEEDDLDYEDEEEDDEDEEEVVKRRKPTKNVIEFTLADEVVPETPAVSPPLVDDVSEETKDVVRLSEDA